MESRVKNVFIIILIIIDYANSQEFKGQQKIGGVYTEEGTQGTQDKNVISTPTALAIGLPISVAILLLIVVLFWLFYRQKKMYKTLQRISTTEIKQLEKIGEGNFGDVWTAKYKKDIIVVKTLKESASEKEEKDFRDEALLLSQFHHENIVKCVGICLQSRPVMVALEYLNGGSLKTFLQKDTIQFLLPVQKLIHIISEIGKGCLYLETKGYIHRDLAARNCLVSMDLKQVKITDFGMAKDIGKGSTYYRTRNHEEIVPVPWTSPEGLLGKEITMKSDVWSFGVLMYEVFTWSSRPFGHCSIKSKQHKCPLNTPTMDEIMFKICVEHKTVLNASPAGPCTGEICGALKTIMEQCFQFDADDRPGFKKLLDLINGAATSIKSQMVFTDSLLHENNNNEAGATFQSFLDQAYGDKSETRIELVQMTNAYEDVRNVHCNDSIEEEKKNDPYYKTL